MDGTVPQLVEVVPLPKSQLQLTVFNVVFVKLTKNGAHPRVLSGEKETVSIVLNRMFTSSVLVQPAKLVPITV